MKRRATPRKYQADKTPDLPPAQVEAIHEALRILRDQHERTIDGGFNLTDACYGFILAGMDSLPMHCAKIAITILKTHKGSIPNDVYKRAVR